MCGVVGYWSRCGQSGPLLAALSALQHRGQEGAGVLLGQGQYHQSYTGPGLLGQALPLDELVEHPLNQALGHLRYATSGTLGLSALQPLSCSETGPLALVHNGNLTNLAELRSLLQTPGSFVSDTDLLLRLLAEQLPLEGTPEQLLSQAEQLLSHVQGGYACIAWFPGELLAFRDPLGIRPLQLGRRFIHGADEWLLASESHAIESAGFEFIRDLAPGELLLIDRQGELHSRILSAAGPLTPSVFEYVYFSASESYIDGISVRAVRQDLGRRLAQQLQDQNFSIDDAVVVPVPSTSQPAAFGLSEATGLPYQELLRKKPGVGRSFILSNPKAREQVVRDKFELNADDVYGRHLLLVDDSIVRGTTLKFLVKWLYQLGVARITLCCAAPPVRFSDCYGIDLPEVSELLASNLSEQAIASRLGVDQLLFLPQQELINALHEQNPAIEHFECALFDGKYVAGFQNKAQANRLLSENMPPQFECEAIPA